jgi:hypothetical protein
MGTEVLRPQDCLGERFRVSPPASAAHRRKSSFTYHGNGNNNYRKPLNRSERLDTKRKQPGQQTDQQQPRISPRRNSSTEELQKHNGNYENGPRVMILRRGQSLDSFEIETKMKKENNNRTTSKGGIMMKKKLMERGGGREGYYGDSSSLYAGSAFAVSPSPESLPLPSFFNISSIKNRCDDEFEDSASRDLRRLLRLE